jgi:hypothetical protein
MSSRLPLPGRTVLALLAVSLIACGASAVRGADVSRSGQKITTPGAYRVTADLKQKSGDTPLIEIRRALNVTLRLDGHTLTGPGATKGVGIRIANCTNVVILGEKGTVRSCGIAVEVTDSRNVQIKEDLTLQDNGVGVTMKKVIQGHVGGVVCKDNHQGDLALEDSITLTIEDVHCRRPAKDSKAKDLAAILLKKITTAGMKNVSIGEDGKYPDGIRIVDSRTCSLSKLTIANCKAGVALDGRRTLPVGIVESTFKKNDKAIDLRNGARAPRTRDNHIE